MNTVGGVVIGQVIGHFHAAADDRIAVSKWLPGSADIRIELPGRVVRKLPGYARVSVEERAGGSIGIHRAVDVGKKRRIIEGRAAVKIIHRHVLRRPANPADNRKPGAGVERILDIEAGSVAPESKLLLLALREGAHCSPQKIQVGIAINSLPVDLPGRAAAAEFAVESKVAVRLVSNILIKVDAQEFSANHKLMPALDPGQVVGDAFVVKIEVPRRTGSAVSAPRMVGARSRCRNLQKGRICLVVRDVERSGIWSARRRAAMIDAFGAHGVDVVYEVRRDAPRLSDDRRLHPLI